MLYAGVLGSEECHPAMDTVLLSLKSVFVVIAGALILHQQMTGREYLGRVLMMSAVILAQTPNPFEKKVKA